MIRVLCSILSLIIHVVPWANDTLPENQPLIILDSADYTLGNEMRNYKLRADNFRNAKVFEIAVASEKINVLRKKMQSKYNETMKENHLVELRIANNAERGFRLKLRNNLLLLGVWIFIALIALVLLVIIWNKKVVSLRAQQLTRATFDAREEEKLRFSRELHDDFQATLSIIHIMATQEFTKAPENKNYEMITKNTKTAISEIRSISKELYPTEINTIGLFESLHSLIERTNARQITTHFRLHGDDIECTVALRMTWFRVVQKLMKNTINVSNASEVSMAFATKANGMELAYTELMFNQKDASDEMSLKLLSEFIQSLGGKFSFYRSINGDCGYIVFFEDK